MMNDVSSMTIQGISFRC